MSFGAPCRARLDLVGMSSRSTLSSMSFSYKRGWQLFLVVTQNPFRTNMIEIGDNKNERAHKSLLVLLKSLSVFWEFLHGVFGAFVENSVLKALGCIPILTNLRSWRSQKTGETFTSFTVFSATTFTTKKWAHFRKCVELKEHFEEIYIIEPSK